MKFIKIIRAKIEYVLVRTGFFISFLVKIRCRLPLWHKDKIIKIKQIPDNAHRYCYENSSVDVRHIKSLVIFASYFPNEIISLHTIYYLEKLKSIFDGIILISDSFLPESEINKIKHLIVYCECAKHCEYDFGSYKRGYNYAKSRGILNNINRLLLCNDSVVGPVFNLKEIIDKMSPKADFWGLMESEEIRYHLQSWFMCFENRQLINNEVGLFLNKVKKEKYFWDIVLNYETKFTKTLRKGGYTCASYTSSKIPETKEYEMLNHSGNKVFYPLIMMKKYNFPFVKIKYLSGEYNKRVIDSKNETLDYIKQNNFDLYKIIVEEFC